MITNWSESILSEFEPLEQIQDTDEEQKDESNPIPNQGWRDNKNWILIKEDTDRLALIQIMQLLDRELLGEKYEAYSFRCITNKLDECHISDNAIDNEPGGKTDFEDPEYRLMNRSKWSHLTYDEQLHLYMEHHYNSKTISELCKKYCISLTTVKRIMKLFGLKIKRHEIYSKVRWRKSIQQPYIQNTIREFVNQQSASFVAADVKRFVKSKLRVEIPEHQIRSYMKNSLNLSYKKGSRRPINLDIKRHQALKQLYVVRLTNKLSKIRLLWNLDEWSINRDTSNNYSWLARGKSCTLNNIVFKNSINTISIIASNGLLMNLFKHETTNSSHLVQFIRHFIEYVRDHYKIKPEHIGIILDNCQTHRSNIFRSWCQEWGVNLYYLNSYAPEL